MLAGASASLLAGNARCSAYLKPRPEPTKKLFKLTLPYFLPQTQTEFVSERKLPRAEGRRPSALTKAALTSAGTRAMPAPLAFRQFFRASPALPR